MNLWVAFPQPQRDELHLNTVSSTEGVLPFSGDLSMGPCDLFISRKGKVGEEVPPLGERMDWVSPNMRIQGRKATAQTREQETTLPALLPSTV